MRHPRSPERDALAGPASAPRERAIAALYAEHWSYVRDLLPSYRIAAQDVEDVAQTAWAHVYRRRDSYDAAKHQTPRAWITGFVQRCAANHRRAQRHERVTRTFEESEEQVLAPDLDPEQAASLRDLHRMIPNEEQLVALLLQVRHGLSIAEIAAVQEVSASAVERRLSMARKALMDDKDEKKSRAFLGYGSLEALAKVLKPRPIPPEVGEREWRKLVERIRQEEAAASETDPPPSSSSQPPAAALPAQASPTAPTLGALGNAKIGIVLLLAFVGGSGVLAWKANGAMAHGPATTAAMDAATAPSATPSTSSASSTSTASSSTASTSSASSTPTATASSGTTAPSATPSTSSTAPSGTTAPSATPSTSSTAPSGTTAPSAPLTASSAPLGGSQLVLARMREALNRRHFSTVLALAALHAQQFGATNLREREALRIEALRQTGRTKDAAQHASAVLAAYPEHRRAMERAAGQALP